MTNSTVPSLVIGGVMQSEINTRPSDTFVVDNKLNLTITEIIEVS